MNDPQEQLLEAIRQGDAKKVKALIYDGADADSPLGVPYGPKNLALLLGDLAVINAMFDANVRFDNVSIENTDYSGLELLLSVPNVRPEVIKTVLERGPKFSEIKWRRLPPLMTHGALTNPLIMRLLLDAGADPKCTTHDGLWTALEYAVIWGHPDCLTMLIERGANAAASNRWKRNAWHTLAARKEKSADAIAQILKNTSKADIEQKDAQGYTPLGLAAVQSPVEVVSAMLAAGAKVDNPGGVGQVPLITAALMNSADVVKVIIDAGANVNSTDQQNVTALYWAVQSGDPFFFQEWQRSRKQSRFADPLIAAKYADAERKVDLLLKAGADPNIASRRGILVDAALYALPRSARDYADQAVNGSATDLNSASPQSGFTDAYGGRPVADVYAAANPVQIIEMLIKAGARRRSPDGMYDAFDVAARRFDSHRDSILDVLRKAPQ